MVAELVATNPGGLAAYTTFTYKQENTAVITGVSPRRGGTAGGTRVTITGTNFNTFVVVQISLSFLRMCDFF